jgi:hypothetical protein
MQSARKGILGFAKQTAVGTPAANPAYTVPIMSSGLSPNRETEQLPETGVTLGRGGLAVIRAAGGGPVNMIARPASAGLLIYEVMGAQAITGAGPFDHAFTFSDVFPLPLTVWQRLGADYWWRYADCFVGQLTIRGASGGRIEVEPEFVMLGEAERVAAPSFTMEGREPYFKYIGSITKLEADNATPVVVDNVEAFELVINRAPILRHHADLGASKIMPSARDADFSATVTQDSDGNNQGWDYLAAAYLGSVAATGPVTQAIARGSFEVTSGRHPADATRFLKLASNGAIWEYGVENPQPDPGGEPVTLEVVGPLKEPAAGSEVTINVLNEVAAVY